MFVCCAGFSFDQKYHIRWQLSRSLTTQHLLTMVTTQATPPRQPTSNHGGISRAIYAGFRDEYSDEPECRGARPSDQFWREETQTERVGGF